MKRVDTLTQEQKGRFTEWSDKWIKIGLSTQRSDRQTFEENAEKCYIFSGIKYPGVVHWVDSPYAMVQKLAEIEGKKFAKDNWFKYIGGQFWVGGWGWGSSYKSFFREVCSLELPGNLDQRAIAYQKTQEASCWWFPTDKYIIAVERPSQINRDSQGRLHSDISKAISWPDGWGVYSIHGAIVPEWIILEPNLITVEKIDQEKNVEIRRILIDRYPGGAKKYALDAGSVLIDTGEMDHEIVGLRGAKLWSRDVPGDVPIFTLEMINSTSEPDGNFKNYHIRIDPTCYDGKAGKTVWAAMASSWRKADNKTLRFKKYTDYCPEVES